MTSTNATMQRTHWLREIVHDRVRPSTYRSYDWPNRCYVVPLLGNKRLARLQPPDLRVFLNRVKQTCRAAPNARTRHG